MGEPSSVRRWRAVIAADLAGRTPDCNEHPDLPDGLGNALRAAIRDLLSSGAGRLALARRDLGMVYRLLSGAAITQRQIGALTGQSRSEVAAIAAGRQVSSYDVLVRVADGLRLPRGWMGLAYDDETAGWLLTAAILDPGEHW